MTAVMSYATWKSVYHGDPAVVGGTFRVNTKPVTIVGIAPKGFFGDRLSPSPPEFYLPIETMPPIANVVYVHGSDAQWLYIIGRVRPGVSLGTLQEKVTTLLRQQLATRPNFSSKESQAKLKKMHVVLTAGGGASRRCRRAITRICCC